MRGIYQKVMRLAATESVFTDGDMFDLMYVNPQLADRQYAFLRKTGDKLALVVVNFSTSEVHAEVRIPSHAFDFLKIKETKTTAVELLTKEEAELELKAENSLSVKIPAYGGVIYKMQLS